MNLGAHPFVAGHATPMRGDPEWVQRGRAREAAALLEGALADLASLNLLLTGAGDASARHQYNALWVVAGEARRLLLEIGNAEPIARSDDVYLCLSESISKLTETVSAQADVIVQLSRPVST
jgi:hypothetical protein